MRLEDYLIEKLIENGMFKNQAKQVLEMAKKHSLFRDMDVKWDEDTEHGGYPSSLITVVWISIRMVALDWIDKNCPKAFYRPMFDDEQMKQLSIRQRKKKINKA